MKKLIAFALCALIFASAFTSCAPIGKTLDPRIKVTSSDAADAAAWLDARLAEVPGPVVIGTDSSAYGVDLTALEADGYVIRDLGGETAIFARTADGLDRAVRKFAKMAEANCVTDAAYHEGARVTKLPLAGRDISEYTVYCENEYYMKVAAADFASLVERATGFKPAVSTETPAVPYIALRYVHDESLRNVGYRWSVDEGGLTIECSDIFKSSSAHYAERRFLQNALDWYGLDFGFEDLAASDLVELAVGESGGETPGFDWAYIYDGGSCKYERYDNNFQNFGLDRHSCHGIQAHAFAGELSSSPNRNWAEDMPCWIDEDFYEVSLYDIEEYIKSFIAAGQTLDYIDVAAGDNAFWCTCKDCVALLKKEGSYSAHVLTWANRLSEELGETYPDIYYGVFAYAGSNRPPKTIEAADHVCVTFCCDHNCSEHPLDGSRCTWGDPSPGRANGPRDNPTYAEYMRKWCSICDNVYVWYYGLPNGFLTMSFVHTVRDDWTFLHDIGAKGVFWEAEAPGYDANFIAYQLAFELVWNTDMTDGEYDAAYDRILAATYGEEVAPLVKEYLKVIDRIYEASKCQDCWAWAKIVLNSPEVLYALYADPDGIADQYDLMFDLVEAAFSTAPDLRTEKRLAALEASVIYKGSVAAYPKARSAGDEGRMAELSRRYRLMVERLAAYGVDVTAPGAVDAVFAADIGLGRIAYPATIEELYPEGENRERYIDPKPFE